MALSQSVVSELLYAFRAGEGVDLIRDAVQLALQELIETEATEQIGATDRRSGTRSGKFVQSTRSPLFHVPLRADRRVDHAAPPSPPRLSVHEENDRGAPFRVFTRVDIRLLLEDRSASSLTTPSPDRHRC